MEQALDLRQKILKAESCSFDTTIVADYGDVLYEFKMHCSIDKIGDLTFEVTQPATIQGIKGKISASGGGLIFEDKVLAFAPMADDQLTPVSAPWIFMQTLRSGYIEACGETEEGTMLRINDSYREDALQLTILLNEKERPIYSQIMWKNKKVLSLTIENFTIS